jgi:hypothetical protein
MSEYRVSETIRLEPGCHVTPAWQGRVFRAAPDFIGPMFALVQPDASAAEKEIQGIYLADLTLIGNGRCTGIQYSADRGVAGSNPRSNTLERLRIEQCGVGVLVADAEGGALRDCKFINNQVGLQTTGNAAGLHLDHCDFRHNQVGLRAVVSKPASEWLLSRCHFESHTGWGVILSGVRGWSFDTCKFEGNDGGHVTLDWPPGNDIALRPDGHAFRSCAFNASASGVAIDVRAGNDLLFAWCSASPSLPLFLRIPANVGWRSLILGRAMPPSQVKIEGTSPQRVLWLPGLLA